MLFEANLFRSILFFLLISLSCAETTFFDNQDDSGYVILSDFTPDTAVSGINERSCVYIWNCTNWTECSLSGEQTRNCTNIGTCLSIYNPPKINQNCTYTAQIDRESEKKNETETIIKRTVTDNISNIDEISKGGETGNEIIDNNRALIYFIIILIIILYLKRGGFRKKIRVYIRKK